MGGPLVLHLLTAASLPELLRLQLRLSPGPAAAPPPLSSLGLQLCRSTGDPRDFRRDVKGMTEASIPLQFDGDCIDEQLIKTAFELNPAYSTLENDFSLLADKDFLLPLVVQRSYDQVAGESEGCVVAANSSRCWLGRLHGEAVMYPDTASTAWLGRDLAALLATLRDKYGVEARGWHVTRAQPRDEDTEAECAEFPYTPRDAGFGAGVVCQHATQRGRALVQQHAGYSREVARGLASTAAPQYLTRSEVGYGEAGLGGYQGSQVEASWAGLGRSLREVLVLGLAGQREVSMPVCGTRAPDTDTAGELGQLCLRWTQLAAWMPGLRAWYEGGDSARLPYQLAKQYQEYISWALDTRYSLLPYLRSLQLAGAVSGLPPVRPMFLHYSASSMMGLWTQFMLGPDLVIAAVTSADQQLVQVSLPAGTWYDLYSGVQVSHSPDLMMDVLTVPAHAQYYSSTEHAELPVPTKLYQLPVFLRGGSVIMMYESLPSAKSIKVSGNWF